MQQLFKFELILILSFEDYEGQLVDYEEDKEVDEDDDDVWDEEGDENPEESICLFCALLCCVFMFHCIMYYLLCNLIVHA
jgi:hypothetical protein